MSPQGGGLQRQMDSLPHFPQRQGLVFCGGGAGRSRRTSFPPLSRFLGSPSLPSFCLKQIKMAELSSLEENMEVIMEVQLSTFPRSWADAAACAHSRNSISRGAGRKITVISFHFLDGGHPVLSRNTPSPSALAWVARREGVCDSSCFPRDPGRGSGWRALSSAVSCKASLLPEESHVRRSWHPDPAASGWQAAKLSIFYYSG